MTLSFLLKRKLMQLFLTHSRALIDLAELHQLSTLIKKPTRITGTSTSLIDVIFTSKPRSFRSSGVNDIGISDHSLVYAVMRSHCPRPCMKIKNKRSFKHFDQDLFSRNVSQIPFHVGYVFDDVDDVAWAWGKIFTDLLDEHAPVKKKAIKREHVPFMTTDLLDAIRKLKQTYYATKHPVDWQKYKEQRNKTSSLRRKLICKYIRSKCDDAKGDLRAFWTIITPFTDSKKNRGDNTITLKVDH